MSRLTLGSNLAAVNAQRRLGQAAKDLESTAQRLSSGLRINHGADDASGLAISSLLNVDSRVLNQGVRNINDAVSLLDVAEGALGQETSILLRLRELSTQASNGIYSNAQRTALDNEAQALSREYNRILRTTNFNQISLLTNADTPFVFQAGYGSNASLSLTLGDSLSELAGDGTFTTASSFVTTAINGLESEDINGDGYDDLIASNTGPYHKVTVYLGNGNGTFQAEVSYASNNRAPALELSDFNNDGYKDIVVTNNTANLSILFGNGNGTFRAAVTYNTVSDSSNVEVGDVDGDGIEDIVTDSSPASAYITVLLGNSNGTFKASTSFLYSTSAPTQTSHRLELSDLNNDGNLDVAISNDNNHRLVIMLGNGNGTFNFTTSFATGNGNAEYLNTADVNEDGVLDLISDGGAAMGVFIGNGDGTFRSRISLATAGSGNNARTSILDFNNDGHLDIAYARVGLTGLGLMLGNGNGTFLASLTFGTISGAVQTALGDFNGDGVTDIAGALTTGVETYLSNTQRLYELRSFSLATRTEALAAQEIFDESLENIQGEMTNIGAISSRLSAALSNLKVSSLGFRAAASQITDADVAYEAGQFAARQIQRDFATSILAQANQQSAIAIKLLQ